jgi:antitoxin MazE
LLRVSSDEIAQRLRARYPLEVTEAFMRAKIEKWGNGLAVRIPKEFAQEAGLHPDADVEMSVRQGDLVLAPSRREYTLEELVSKITPENRHQETDLGVPVGREIL